MYMYGCAVVSATHVLRQRVVQTAREMQLDYGATHGSFSSFGEKVDSDRLG